MNWKQILASLAKVGAFFLWFILWCAFIAVVLGTQFTFWPKAGEDAGWVLLALSCIAVCAFAALPMWETQRNLWRYFNGK